MEKPKASTLSQAVGVNLRALREGGGVRQEDIAASARNHGFPHWTRATVAAIELGRRELTFTEAAMLPFLLYGAGIHVELAELVPDKGKIQIQAETETTLRRTMKASDLRRAFLGTAVDAARALSRKYLDMTARVAPEALAAGDTEVKAAARIGMTPLALTQAALRLWGRSLSDERERRVRERVTGNLDPRSLQALRGHVTRALLAEIDNASLVQ